jgi:sulfoxide reductase heme-binding subunit YedZ
MSGTLPWYVARSSGLVAWALLAGSVVWGLLMTSKIVRGRVKGSWLLDLHRWLGGLALVFTGVHVAAIMGDSYVHFGLASVMIPLAAHWHPVAVAWGVVSVYLLIAVEATSLARRHLNVRLWKRVHFVSFPLFVTSTIHGLSAGTDGRTPMAITAALLTAGAVAVLSAVRVRQHLENRGPRAPSSSTLRATRRPEPSRPAAA